MTGTGTGTLPHTNRTEFNNLTTEVLRATSYNIDALTRYVDENELMLLLAVLPSLEPFLYFLFCEPGPRPGASPLRIGLLSNLLRCSPHDSTRDGERPQPATESVIRLMFSIVPRLPMTEDWQLMECQLFLSELQHAMLPHSSFWFNELSQLSLQLVCLTHSLLIRTGDCEKALSLLMDLINSLSARVPWGKLLLATSLLLLQAPSDQFPRLLALLQQLLSSGSGQPGFMNTLVIMPLLQAMSVSGVYGDAACKQLATDLLERLEEPGVGADCSLSKGEQLETELPFPLTSWYGTLHTLWCLAQRLHRDQTAVHIWLGGVRASLAGQEHAPDHLVLLLAGLLVNSRGNDLSMVLDTVAQLAKTDPTQTPSLMLVLMYKLGKQLEPVESLGILYTLPALGTHKACIPQILGSLHALSTSPKLRPLTMRLLTKLWNTQDRVFPQLQKSLAALDATNQAPNSDLLWQSLLARAATIRDIAKFRPWQHAADMLAAAVRLLSECDSPSLAKPAAFALHAIHALCQAEVLDLLSTWMALGAKLRQDSRPTVLCAVCQLLALVPTLHVSTAEYERFRANVVVLLWDLTQNQDCAVACAAYQSLAVFKPSDHVEVLLVEQESPEVGDEQIEAMEVERVVPGGMYIRLLLLTPTNVLPAFEKFMSVLMESEINDMPRGVFQLALRRAASEVRGHALSGVPSFMLHTYEKNRQPGLNQGLAGGLLACYDLPIQMDRESRPIPRFLLSRSRSFQQMLAALVHEVPIQPSEWLRCLLLPQSWLGFMERAFDAVLQGRNGELELEQRRGREVAETDQLHCTAWLWARDALTKILKSSVNDSPVVQGNALLALGGLAAAVLKFECSLPVDDRAMQTSEEHNVWIDTVLETLLGVLDSRHQRPDRGFSWLQQCSLGETSCRTMARGCASLGLALLVPMLGPSRMNRLLQVITVFGSCISGQLLSGNASQVQMHLGLALGLLLSRAVRNSNNQEVNACIMDGIESLQNYCFKEKLEHTDGCMLGLGLVLSALCQSGQANCQDKSRQMLSRLSACLADAALISRQSLEAIGHAVACACVAAFDAGILPAEEAENIMSKLRMLVEKNQQSGGLSLSLGAVVSGLSCCGHGQAEELASRLFSAWTKLLLAESCPTMQRLAAANGLAGLAGMQNQFVQIQTELMQSTHVQQRVQETVRVVTQVISFSGAVGLQAIVAWLLGNLHLCSNSRTQASSAAPPNYSYLPETSVISPAVDLLIETGRRGAEAVTVGQVCVVLASLRAGAACRPLPPLDWIAVLTPLFRLDLGVEVQQQCIQLLASQAAASKSAASMLTTLLTRPMLPSLQAGNLTEMWRCLSLWLHHVPENKLQAFLEMPSGCVPLHTLLHGLHEALALPGLPLSLYKVLHQALSTFFLQLPTDPALSELKVYTEAARCLSRLTDEDIDTVTDVDKAGLLRATLARSLMVVDGRVPLVALNDCVRASVGHPLGYNVCWVLLQALYQARLSPKPSTGASERLEWLLELMGHTRGIAYRAVPVSGSTVAQAVRLLLTVFGVAVLAWADDSAPLLLGLSSSWLAWKLVEAKSEIQPCSTTTVTLGLSQFGTQGADQALSLLPYSLPQLLIKEPWKQCADKFIDWLSGMVELPTKTVGEQLTVTLKAGLLSLRGLPEFRQLPVWSRAYGW
uniref:focadhesin-like n=1 Tax=Myxine glutinosa TaxID=7769 RepID=UPI00358E3842